ncbi:hypothetical protein MXB_3089, partial [Myxobolus squamalis]
HTCGKPIAGTGEFSNAKTYTVDQIRILSMDLWPTPNNIYFNICKNAGMVFNSAAFTIPTKQKLHSRWDGFLEVQLVRENLERKQSASSRRNLSNCTASALVIMTFNRATSCFVPCMFALLIGKGKRLYLRLIHKIIGTPDWVQPDFGCYFPRNKKSIEK